MPFLCYEKTRSTPIVDREESVWMYAADSFPVPSVKDRVGSARMMAAKTQSLPTNPFSKGTGGDYSLDRPPLMDEINTLNQKKWPAKNELLYGNEELI